MKVNSYWKRDVKNVVISLILPLIKTEPWEEPLYLLASVQMRRGGCMLKSLQLKAGEEEQIKWETTAKNPQREDRKNHSQGHCGQ